MLHVIIRTCLRDDGIAKICYDSFIYNKIEAKYSFLADNGSYKYITQCNQDINYKEYSDNYGGQFGVKGLLMALKKYDFKDNDTIILSDSDILVLGNFVPLVVNFDHIGVGSYIDSIKMHKISGQMQIFNGLTLNKLVNLSIEEIDKYVKEMVTDNKDVADDSFNSYMTDKWNCKKGYINFSNKQYWIHNKLYSEIGNDINNIIKKYLN